MFAVKRFLQPIVRQNQQVRTVVITRNKKDNKLIQLRERSKRRRKSIEKYGPGRKDRASKESSYQKPRESAASLWLLKDKERQMQRERSELGQNIKKLREFTEELKLRSAKEKEEKTRVQIEKELTVLGDPNKLLEQDVETLVNTLLEEDQAKKVMSLKLPGLETSSVTKSSDPFSPLLLFEGVDNEAVEKLPPILIDKLGKSVKYIRNKRTLSWELMIRDLANNGGLKNMNQKEVTKLFLSIPKEEKHKCVSMISEMMDEAGIEKDVLVYNLFLSAYASDKNHEVLVESLFEEMKAKDLKPDLYTFSAIVKSHGISDNVEKINQLLSIMKNEYGLEPNKQIYTSVLQTCVRLNDHKQAAEVFDTMKFLSVTTQPDAKTYESIILSFVEDDNVERALDLYDEMLAKQPQPLKPSLETLLLLARGCASRKELFNQGWNFIFEYYDRKFEPNAKMLETMMHLLAKDGDVSFVRALFNTLMESRVDTLAFNPGSVSISLLMLAYARFDINHTPVTLLNDRVKMLRSRTIDVTTFNFLPPKSPPFLPIDLIVSDKSIIAESNAIWAYIILNFSDFVDEKVVGSYLFAAASRGENISEFIRRFETITYLDEEGIPLEVADTLDETKTKEAEIIVEEATEEVSPDPLEQALKTIKSEPPAVQLSFASNFKIPRTSEFYNIAIVAAKHFKDLDFATRIWTERGKFRKSANFKKLSSKKRYDKDFEFARYMLSFFTEMKLLEDLTMIVLSSQNQFNWEWHHVKPTYVLAEISGNEDIKRYLSNAVNNKNFMLRPQNTYIHPEQR